MRLRIIAIHCDFSSESLQLLLLTMESLPLKELDFGLQKPTGPRSGVVASIVLIIIALSSVIFFFFYITHTPFILYWKILVLRTTFWDFSKSELLFQNHKKTKLCHKVIIFISLERSCVTLSDQYITFLFPILLSSYLNFCEKMSKIFLKNSKKIMKSAKGKLHIDLKPLLALYKYP